MSFAYNKILVGIPYGKNLFKDHSSILPLWFGREGKLLAIMRRIKVWRVKKFIGWIEEHNLPTN